MAAYNITRTGKLFDKKIIGLLEAIKEKFGQKELNVVIGSKDVSDDIDKIKPLFTQKSQSISSALISTFDNKFKIRYLRGVSKSNTQPMQDREASAYFDEIVVEYGNDQPNRQTYSPNAEEVLDLESIIKKFVIYVEDTSSEGGANSVSALLEQQLTRLSSVYEDMISGVDKKRSQLDEEHATRIKELNASFNEKEKNFRNDQIKENERLKKKELELEEKTKALDDRNHMHVRRDLTDRINKEVKSRLQNTIVQKPALILRWGVFSLSLIIAGFLAYISYFSLQEAIEFKANSYEFLKSGIKFVPEDSVQSIMSLDIGYWYILIVKALVSAIGAVGFFVYSLKWLRQMYLDDVRTYREIERYAYDINRSSWIVETIMEMETNQKGSPPQAWINAVCNNLFGNLETSQNEPKTDMLADILNSSAKVQLSSDGVKFEMNGKGAKKFAKELSDVSLDE